MKRPFALPTVSRHLEEAAFVQARLLDGFIALAKEAWDREQGFTRESIGDLLDTLREERRSLGQLARPRVIALPRQAA